MGEVAFILKHDKDKEVVTRQLKEMHTNNDKLMVLTYSESKEMIFSPDCIVIGNVEPNKEDAILLDHAGNILRNGFPEDFEPQELCKGERGQSKDQNTEPEERLPSACPKCGRRKDPGQIRCPECNYEHVRKSFVESDDSVLTEVKRKPTAAEKRNREWSKEDKQAFYSGLLSYAAEKGYKEGYAANQFKQYLSVWPNAYEKVRGEITPDIRNFIKSQNIAYANRRNK